MIQPTKNTVPGRRTAAAALAFLLALGTGFLFRARPELARTFVRDLEGLFVTRSHCGERNPSTSLKTISSAQADFRANDRDHDGMNQFWRGDIAGLYALLPKDATAERADRPGEQALKLIELSVASADDRPVTEITRFAVRAAKAGYWYRAIRHADEDPKALDPQRFAACAFPDSPSAGKYIFILDENNTIFRAPASGRRGIEVFPTDEELQKSWSKLD